MRRVILSALHRAVMNLLFMSPLLAIVRGLTCIEGGRRVDSSSWPGRAGGASLRDSKCPHKREVIASAGSDADCLGLLPRTLDILSSGRE